MRLIAGAKFDRYTIESLLGEGGMGEVYCAFDPKLARRVALKVMSTKVAAGEDLDSRGRERLVREARAAAALVHANAVSIFDVGDVDGRPFIAMEYIPGRSLRAYVGDASVTMAQRVAWLLDVARALSAAHKRGLVHRDIKPENVMVRDDGIVKVLDFGIARQSAGFVDPNAATQTAATMAPATITEEGAIIGTPLYMAPEQLRGDPFDARADQFAWGVLAYELTTGSVPWRNAGSGVQVVAAILSADVEPPSKHSPDIPPNVDAAIVRALAKSPRERFASMDELVSNVAGGSVTPPTLGSARPASAALEPRTLSTHASASTSARRPGARALGIVAGLLATAGVVVAVVSARVRVPDAPPSTPSTPTDASSLALAPKVAPTAMTALALPPTHDPNALAAYRAGMQAMRDGAFTTALAKWEEATVLDPTLAAAHLRIAIHVGGIEEADPDRHFQAAVAFRSMLSSRDQRLLTAMEPAFLKRPADTSESRRRIVAMAAELPGDAEAQLFAASELDPPTPEAYEALLALDPQFGLALWYAAQVRYRGGDDAATLRTLERCLEVAPAAVSCLRLRAALWIRRGDCTAAQSDARRMLGVEGSSRRTFEVLAGALYGSGESMDAVKAALAQKWAATAPRIRAQTELADQTKLAVVEGDFARAEERALALERQVAPLTHESDHVDAAIFLVEIHRETGRRERATDVAQSYLRRRAAWQPAEASPEYDARPRLLAAGAHSTAEWTRLREEWLRESLATPTPDARGFAWLRAWAAPATTRADAEEALRELPAFLPLPTRDSYNMPSVDLGAVYFLAGRIEDAVAVLRPAAAACRGLDLPFAHMRAQLLLAQSLEAQGDKRGACAAYADVLARWGAAKPRSVSAELARRHAASLACERLP